MKAFKAYDIRGIYNTDFNKEDVYKIGYFLPQLLNAKKVLVGRDVRLSSNEIFDYLAKGITDSGADVYDMGLTTTPMVYYTTAKEKFDASVQITASHNRAEYNGLKISTTDAIPIGYDTGLADLEKMIQTKECNPKNTQGKIIQFYKKDEYVTFLKTYLPEISNLNIGIDCSNGMASLIIKEILGESPHYIFDQLDGTFPNHDPNPLELENVKDLQLLVLDNNLDIGIIYDGDADRVMFVDEQANFISPDLIIGLMAYHFLEKEKGKVLEDIRTSKSVRDFIQQFGSTVDTWRVGRAYATRKLREIKGIYGGELAGHYYFRDFYYSDSGILASLIVLNIVARFKKEGKCVSELISEINKYANSGELNYKVRNKEKVMDDLKSHFSQNEDLKAFYDFDGYRLEFKNWWFNVRPSNTEPYLRLLVEANDENLLMKKLDEIDQIINESGN